MRWGRALQVVRMQRVALVAPRSRLRDLLVEVADAGTVELDLVADSAPDGHELPAVAALRRVPATAEPTEPMLTPALPDLEELLDAGRADLLAGEAELQRRAAGAIERGSVAALAGWTPADDLPALAGRLAPIGAAVAPLPAPRGVEPPSRLHGGPWSGAVRPLVETYAAVPYADLDPTLVAGLAYVVMFGMMFGDVGHGLLLVVAGLMLRVNRPARFARLRRAWPFVTAAGAAAVTFGLLYGEFFGPTGLVPVLWLAPSDQPIPLLAAAVGLGAVLLGGAYLLGTVNRWREGGPGLALYSASGIAGTGMYVGAAAAAAGWYLSAPALATVGAALALVGSGLAFIGLVVEAGGGAAGIVQAVVEIVDVVVRLVSSAVSFARLAAFGLTHAALAGLVWRAAVGLWRVGGVGLVGAFAVFAAGNALAFGLEALVAGVQALRLEYYELFSRVFAGEGRPFRPWRIRRAAASVRPPMAAPTVGPG